MLTMSSENFYLAGVLGSPISHSRSPNIHNYWMRLHGLKGSYVPLEISRSDLEQVMRTMAKMGFRGVNITIPHKEAALRYSDIVSDTAAVIGAANTLTFRPDGSIFADNTDGKGFLANINELAPEWKADEGPALVIGAGGAARAIVYSLLWEGAPVIFLTNRTKERAEMLRSDFGNRVKLLEGAAVAGILPSIATIVNTSSLGMTGQPDLVFPYNRLNPNALVMDVVYSPKVTKLLAGAANRGCTVVDGLGMLLHQAAYSFYYWFGIRPEVTPELRQIALSD